MMRSVILRHLIGQDISFEDLFEEFLATIIPRHYIRESGSLVELYFAFLLKEVATSVEVAGGKPITNHPLFSRLKGTWLDNYTLEVDSFHYHYQDGWEHFLNNQNTKVAFFPPADMGPDVITHLRRISSPSASAAAPTMPDRIPLTISSKKYFQPDFDAYKQNYATSNLWEGFKRDGRVVNGFLEEQAKLDRILQTKFGTSRRALRIIFAYVPLSSEGSSWEEDSQSIILTLDKLHPEFERHLRTATPKFYEWLNHKRKD